MKKINKLNFKENKKLGIEFFIIISVFAIVGLITVSSYNKKLKELIKEESKITLQEASSQNIFNLNSIIDEKQGVLKYLAQAIKNSNNFDIEDNLKILKLYEEFNNFYDMGIIDKNGDCYTTLGEKFNVSKYSYFMKAINGSNGVYSGYNTSSGEDVTVFTEPVYLNNEAQIVLISTYKSKDFSNLLNIPSFDNNGNVLVLDSQGTLVADTYNKDGIYNNKEDIIEAIYNSKNSSENFVEFDYLGNEYLAYYEATGINDWYLISYVPKEYVYKNLDKINSMIVINNIVVYLIIIVLIIILFNSYVKYQKKISSIIFIDDLTEQKNVEYLKFEFQNMNDKDKQDKSLVVMDIDKFKIINIMYGSEVGDNLLKYIPKAFNEVSPNDQIFKGNGDLFVIIINSTSKEEIINKIRIFENRIREDFEKKIIVPMYLSFGVCSFDKFDDLHSIYNNALISKNEIKGNVNNNISFFTEESKNKIIENRKIEDDFMYSVKNNEFEVWYQPKYNMTTNKIYGAEALVRWRKKDGSLIPPSKFIPVFENTGQIAKLDEFVIETVFKNIKETKELGLDIKPISINLSRVNIYNLDIVDKIKELSEIYKINSDDVSFEITESALIENNTSINELIKKLHKLGFRVDMDDYGVGTSTLNSLFASDFDTLKLDKSFIDYIGNEKMDTIIKSTIRMAKELNLKIIAEGVETKDQVEFLINNNCNIAQGYYFSKPLNKHDYFSLYKEE